MVYKTIKISEDNYRFLLREGAALQHKYGRKITFDDTINEFIRRKNKSLLSFAGTITDKEADEMKRAIARMRELDK